MYRSILKLSSHHATAKGIFKMLYGFESPELGKDVMDLPFKSPVGMAPGFDTDALYYNAAGAAGCGFSIIGPMSFSRQGGIRDAISALRTYPASGNLLIGLCITKSESSVSEDDISRDFLDAFDYGYDFCDFTVLDFSNPDMGPVSDSAFIKAVTDPLLEARLAYDNYHPIVLRLSNSLKSDELTPMLHYCLMNGIDGVMLSGEELIRQTTEFSKGRLPIIAESRIATPAKAVDLIAAGASLVALQCTASRFKPALPKAIMKTLKKK